MQRYANTSGNSGVVGYEIGADWIDVWFKDTPAPYRYDATLPGRVHVAAMQRLARAGRGLAAYISRHVRDRYARGP